MNKLSAFRRHVAGVTIAIATPLVWAQANHHVMIEPANLHWAPVPSLPAGAQPAVIQGPMSAAVPFTVRLKFPANDRIPPYWHPAVERITVLSGTFHMSPGETFSTGNTHALTVGATAIMPARSPHYAWTDSETIVQLHGTGPWSITYLNSSEDPRSK